MLQFVIGMGKLKDWTSSALNLKLNELILEIDIQEEDEPSDSDWKRFWSQISLLLHIDFPARLFIFIFVVI